MSISVSASYRSITAIRRSKAAALCASLCGLGLAVAASAGPRIVSFDAPGAGTGSGQGTGCFAFTDCSVILSNSGAISGYYLDANNVFHGFLRSPEGTFTTFDAPGADTTPGDFNGTLPNAIDDAGAITGVYYDADSVGHGFLRTRDGEFVTFDAPGANGVTNPLALNLEGTAVGYYFNQNDTFGAFLRHPDGRLETWSAPGAASTGAYNVNILGIVVGHYQDNSSVVHGFVRSPFGKLTTFDAPGAGTGIGQGTGCPGCSVGLNLFGVIAGFDIDTNYVVRIYIRGPGGRFTTFTPPGSGPYGINCYSDCSLGLNDWGAVTGIYLDVNNVIHGFVRTPEGTFTSFDAPGANTAPGSFSGTFPYSINDAGVISGYYLDVNNVAHGFVRFP